MKLIVNPHKIEIEKSPVNEKEINITSVEFEFADEITEDYVKEAYFTLNGNSYKQIIINNQCDIPYEVLNKQGQVEIGVVAYLVENEEEIKRYNPSPVYISTLVGSLKDAENSEPITPTDKEQIEQELLNISTQMNNLDIDAEKEEHTTTITITKKDGTTKEVEVLDGEKGEKGDTGAPGQIKMLIVNELPLVGSGDTLYFVPKQDPETSDLYDEYAWLNNKWERLGEKQIDIDLDDYYKKQEINVLLDDKADISDIPDLTDYVKNTDYAADNIYGVIKGTSSNQFYLYNGGPYAGSISYTNYSNAGNGIFIGKGTLENVLNARIGDINTALDTINGEVI